MKYFEKLFDDCEAKNISYIRRTRLFYSLILVAYVLDKDLKEADQEDMNKVMSFMHKKYRSHNSKESFVKEIKRTWKLVAPEKDSRGRVDLTLTPYAVKHLSPSQDKSTVELREDGRLEWENYQRILQYYEKDLKIQFYISLAVESLGRPAEILGVRIKDIEQHENYAKLWVKKGKEGSKFLQCIDSYHYLLKWLRKHPLRNNPEAPLFINENNKKKFCQLTPKTIAVKLQTACKDLGIKKNLTGYSLKRIGVRFSRLRGDSDIQIQHRAGWTSTKQLKIYDCSSHDDALEIELTKRGLIKTAKKDLKKYLPETKVCVFCNTKNAYADDFCSKCQRSLDHKHIQKEMKEGDGMQQENLITNMQKMMVQMQEQINALQVRN
ncbi:MAG: site-specific integrase [archaeon]